jgi:hypothetical protein
MTVDSQPRQEERVHWLPMIAAIAAISVVGIAIGLGMPLLSVVLESRGHSATMIGLNTAVAGIASIAGAPLATPIANRLGVAWAMLLMIAAGALAFVGFRITDAAAVDGKQRESAGLDRAEHQHRGGRGRNHPDIAQETAGFLAVDVKHRAFLARRQHRDGGQGDQRHGDAERQEAGAAQPGEQPRPGGEAERQDRGVDAEHQAAPGRRRRAGRPARTRAAGSGGRRCGR